MNGHKSSKLLLICLLLCCRFGFAQQYILNGSAQKVSCNCYTLTEEKTYQSGSVWNSNKISLSNSFDFWFNVYLGCRDGSGADGVVFILQPISTSVGSSGEGMGFGGVQPSIGIALDTWQNQNLNDPSFDHISIQANGNTNHTGDLAGPVPASVSSDNIEDCKWHKLRISWDANTKWLRAYFDGVLRLEKQVDLISTIFNNDPDVYWGFTGATGGSVNLQQFCTALNPGFTTNAGGNNGCEGAPVNFKDASESFAPIVSYNWSFGDGTFSTAAVPPPHIYPNPGKYTVNLQIKGQDGCEKDSSFLLTIGSIPRAELFVADTCFGAVPRLQFQSKNEAVTYQWSMDGVPFSTSQQPPLAKPAEGAHQVEVVVTSDFFCGNPAKASANFIIKPLPQLTAEVEDGCIRELLSFDGTQTDSKTTISQWMWSLGDGTLTPLQNTQHQYTKAGQYAIKFWALATNGCLSDTVLKSITVNAATAFAGRDTAVIEGYPFMLNGTGNGEFLWSPATNLSNPAISNPVAILNNDQEYQLTVTTPEGCTATDAVLIKTYKGPAIYVPSAFTPNGDGKNETLRPLYVGIKELKQFAVFNRWGQQLFTTTDLQKGWTGKEAPPGTYVWLIQAVDNQGKAILLKGTTTIIR